MVVVDLDYGGEGGIRFRLRLIASISYRFYVGLDVPEGLVGLHGCTLLHAGQRGQSKLFRAKSRVMPQPWSALPQLPIDEDNRGWKVRARSGEMLPAVLGGGLVNPSSPPAPKRLAKAFNGRPTHATLWASKHEPG